MTIQLGKTRRLPGSKFIFPVCAAFVAAATIVAFAMLRPVSATVGEITTVPTGLGAIATAPMVAAAPDGSHLVAFWAQEAGSDVTYLARITATSTEPYVALKVPGQYLSITFAPDSTAYLAGRIDQGTLLKVNPLRTAAEVLHEWGPDNGGVAQDARAVEYLNDKLYVETVARDCNPVTLHELALDGSEVNAVPSSSDQCGGSWQAAQNTLAVSGRSGAFGFFNPDSLAESSAVIGGASGAVMGSDGSWTMLNNFGFGGVCTADTSLVRIDKTGAVLFDKAIGHTANRCDVPGVAVLSDGSAAVGYVDSGVATVYLYKPSTDSWSTLATYLGISQGTLLRFATDNSKHLVVAYQKTTVCGLINGCQAVVVDILDTDGQVVESHTFGGTVGDNLILSGPMSVNDGSTSVAVQRYSESTSNGVQHTVVTTTAPSVRESWHDPAGVTNTQQRRFVSFGDSVAYGHGLVNPEADVRSNLPPNMAPAALAYPKLLADYLGFQTDIRTTGCELGGDFLAVSGATASETNALPEYKNCGLSTRHDSIMPDELNAADLTAKPPTLAVIQGGADDIDFDKCIERILKPFLLDRFNTKKCVEDGAPTPEVQAELGRARDSLLDAVRSIKTQAPDAKVIMLNYYNVFAGAEKFRVAVNGEFDICSFAYQSRKQLVEAQGVLLPALNSAIRHAYETLHGEYGDSIQFVDLTNIMTDAQGVDHHMCTYDPWIFDGEGTAAPPITSDESFWRAAHPNVTGQQKIFEAIRDQLSLSPNQYAN